VAVVELNRPKKRNALSQELIDELTGVLRQLDQDTEVRCSDKFWGLALLRYVELIGLLRRPL
jgi:hypothetical protein